MQPTLFDVEEKNVPIESLVLYALGDFQARGKELINRELPLDRLKGAFRRAAEVLQTAEPSDETLAQELVQLGAKVKKVETFVAKYPYKITVYAELAVRAAAAYQTQIAAQKAVR